MKFQGFAIEGPSQAKIDCQDKEDGSCDVKYYPTEPGEYAVHVMCDGSDIKGSPFMAQIAPADNKTFPEKVKFVFIAWKIVLLNIVLTLYVRLFVQALLSKLGHAVSQFQICAASLKS